MKKYSVFALLGQLLLSVPVWAQEAAAPEQLSFGAQLFAMAPMFVIILGIFYVFVISPQNREEKRHASFVSDLKKGTNVVTSSGMIGRVAGIEKDYILLEVGNGVRMKFLPSHVRQKFEVENS